MVTSVPCNVHSVVFDKKFSKQRHKDLPGGQGWLVCFHLLTSFIISQEISSLKYVSSFDSMQCKYVLRDASE